MSLDNALIWMRASIGSRGARARCIEALEDAIAQRVQASFMFGPQMLKRGTACLARWDGHELLKVDLSDRERVAFQIPWDALVYGLEKPSPHCRAPEHRHAVSDLRFDTAEAHNGNRYLAGWCKIRSPRRTDVESGGRFVLEADYFRPDLPCPARSYWAFYRPHYWSLEQRCRFAFAPLYSKHVPPMHGPLIVHVSVCELANPAAGLGGGVWRISNVSSGHVELCGLGATPTSASP